jgi:2-dehydropantoate 2-reductase
MKIVIIGNGAMGLLFYAQLSPLQTVYLLGRPASSIAPSFSFTNLKGQSREINLTQEANPLAEADLVLCCVKSYQVLNALKPLHAHIPANCPIILMHNGMGCAEHVIPLLKGDQPLLTMLSTQASLKLDSRHIRHTGSGPSQLGLLAGKLPCELKTALLCRLDKALGNVSWDNNIKEKQWLKLAINCAINPLTAIHRVTNGELAQPKYFEQIEGIVDEVVEVARCQQLSLTKNQLLSKISTVIKNTANNKSSMLQDILQQRPTEIDFISGYISQLGKKYGINTLHNNRMLSQVKQLSANFQQAASGNQAGS